MSPAGTTGRAFVCSAAAAASAAARIAGCIADGYFIVVAQRSRREKRKREKFIAHVVREFLAGRNGTEAVGRNQNLHIRQHLQHHRHAHSEAEAVVAQIGTRHADGADHAFQAVRNDGLIGNGEQNVLTNLFTLATPHEETIHLNTHCAKDCPTETMEQRIKYARLCSGKSITEIASSMGIHKDYYKLIEVKCERMNPFNLIRFCQITNADISWVIYGEHQPPYIELHGNTIGQRIRYFRKSNGITLCGLSSTVFGVHKSSSICGWESEKYIPEIRTLMRIASAYNISAISFLPL